MEEEEKSPRTKQKTRPLSMAGVMRSEPHFLRDPNTGKDIQMEERFATVKVNNYADNNRMIGQDEKARSGAGVENLAVSGKSNAGDAVRGAEVVRGKAVVGDVAPPIQNFMASDEKVNTKPRDALELLRQSKK